MGRCDTDTLWISVAVLPCWIPTSGWEMWTTTKLGGSSLRWMPETEREEMVDSFKGRATVSVWIPVVTSGLP